jgi:Ran GTPase-activating protein (RanGAP) involved in mRNA processing and transport
MLEKQTGLKRVNISGNLMLSSTSLVQILQRLKLLPRLADLDLSRLQFKDNLACYKELAELLSQNLTLKSLALQQNSMNDQSAALIVEPLTRSLSVENLRLDDNLLSGVWLEKLCKRITLVGFS